MSLHDHNEARFYRDKLARLLGTAAEVWTGRCWHAPIIVIQMQAVSWEQLDTVRNALRKAGLTPQFDGLRTRFTLIQLRMLRGET